MPVKKTVQDTTYVAVGAAVMGSQKAQTKQRELTQRLSTLASDARTRVEPVVASISEIPSAAMTWGAGLSELPNRVVAFGERFSDTPEKVRSAVSRAWTEGKNRVGWASATVSEKSKYVTMPFTATKNATTPPESARTTVTE
jgi:hypothetical protein